MLITSIGRPWGSSGDPGSPLPPGCGQYPGGQGKSRMVDFVLSVSDSVSSPCKMARLRSTVSIAGGADFSPALTSTIALVVVVSWWSGFLATAKVSVAQSGVLGECSISLLLLS